MSTNSSELRNLFLALFTANTESAIIEVIQRNHKYFSEENWFPVGGNESNYGIIENQQSNPIAALVEKVTNSIDAILTKKCLLTGVAPDSLEAPRSMKEAIERFYPEQSQWDLASFRRQQAEEVQIIADGPKSDTSVIIYDNGEGQNPEDFENTFLSLVRGNKNKIMFVQGKYNMGGAGAIVFCGKRGYQLIASKKYDGKSKFGFTLVREHPFKEGEADLKKNTWYEFLKIDGSIPSFELDGDIDLGLFKRKFKTGSVIKLYSYQFPSGYSGFAQDLNQSLNEFLFEPVLPVYTVDKKERYPNNKVLELDLFGLKRRLEEENTYLEEMFSESYSDSLFGEMKVNCYVFKAKEGKNSVKETKENIKRRFFKNNMSVLFSINGQAHGHYTSEFITRTLKFNLLKDYTLIHVDCTNMKYEFRKELFMASRDRLKEGDEARNLREFLGQKLRKSHLSEIDKRRKDSIGLEGEDTNDLIKSFAKNLPKDSELLKLLKNTIELEQKTEKKIKDNINSDSNKKEIQTFNPKRYPSIFRLDKKNDGEIPIVKVPINGEKVLKFNTDVENGYFDRTEEPGSLEIGLLDYKPNETDGGTKPGQPKNISTLLNIVKSSPTNGTIKIALNPTKEIKVGDEIQIKASLSGPEVQEEIIWLKISEPEKPKEEVNKEEESLENVGLPEVKRVKRDSWDSIGIDMDHKTVMYPIASGDILERIIINLDSNVFLKYRSKLKTEDQIQIAEKRYVASVYFHTLFLYMITKKRGYRMISNSQNGEQDITVDEYLRDIFDSYYSDFLLNFGMEQLINTLSD